MGIGDQLSKIKDNWLLILVGFLVVFFLSGGLGSMGKGLYSSASLGGMDSYSAERSMNYAGSSYSPNTPSSTNFAPEITVRKITKSSYLTSNVKRGEFQTTRQRLGDIITSSGSYLLGENANTYGDEKHPYSVGSYSIKVAAGKYDAVVSQLKLLGEVQSFRESQTDITGTYTNLQIELNAEKARLARYQAMLSEATIIADKITLSDKIFDQERRVKYYEEMVANTDLRVDYSTIQLTLNEKQSDYANLALVKLSVLISSTVSSFNALLQLIFVALPWAVALGIILVIKSLLSRRG